MPQRHDSKIDTIWVSLDGAGQGSFDSIREGASFGGVVQNLKALKALNEDSAEHRIELGIAFVAMKRNVDDLRSLSALARSVGARMISVSNVLPYSREMWEQMLCSMILPDNRLLYGHDALSVNVPLLDLNQSTKEPLYSLLRSGSAISLTSNRIGAETDTCKFVRDGCTFVRWDGAVSPCAGLLHSHVTYSTPSPSGRRVRPYILGNTALETLSDIWESDEYRGFRAKVDAFDFSPCYACGGCQYSETNEEDCFGNTFPTCGGCLWAQGVIQCP